MGIENKKNLCSLSEGVVEEADEGVVVVEGVRGREVAVEVVPEAGDVPEGEPVPGGAEAAQAGHGGVEQDAHEIGGGEGDGGGREAAVVPDDLHVAITLEGGDEDVDVVVAGEGVVVRREEVGPGPGAWCSFSQGEAPREGVEVGPGEGVLALEQIVERVQEAQLQPLPLVVHRDGLFAGAGAGAIANCLFRLRLRHQ